ncbi:MAG: hypothetical protein EOO74_03730 [Myxococcales bacterium]|nr:MAG: hypothetical protein EOO74_03730 [Myxococcales bacterium]
MNRPHHRPMLPGAELFDEIESGVDPAVIGEAASRAATALVRRGHAEADDALVARVVALADDEGLDTLAALWAGSPPDSLAGAVWRLYLLRTWITRNPQGISEEFAAGRTHVPVADAISGVAQPPTPDELVGLADRVLQGLVVGDFADTLFRAAAFVRVVAAGRLGTSYTDDVSAARLGVLADQLHHAGQLELAGDLT